MQDKNIHNNRYFTDRAWGEMKKLLDQELPATERRKNKYFFWWITGAVGSVAFIIAFSLFNNKAVNAHDNSSVSSEYRTSTKATTADNNDEIVEPVNESNEHDSPIIKHHKTQTPQQATPLQKVFKNNGTKNNNALEKQKNRDINEIAPPIALKGQPNISEKNILSENKKINSANNLTHKTTAVKSIKSNIEPLAALPIKELTIDKKIDPVYFSRKNKPGSNTIYASTKFLPAIKTAGIDLGYLRNFSTKKDNLIIQTGIGYSYVNQPLDYILIGLTSQSGGGTSTLVSEILYDLSYANESSVRVLTSNNNGLEQFEERGSSFDRLKLHYLSVPLQLNYTVNKFYFTSGIQASALLFASNDNFEGGLLKGLNSADLEDASLFSNNPASINPDLSNFDLSAQVGVGIHLSENVGIHLQYMSGFNDVIKNNKEKDNNRFFQLSMQYTWR